LTSRQGNRALDSVSDSATVVGSANYNDVHKWKTMLTQIENKSQEDDSGKLFSLRSFTL